MSYWLLNDILLIGGHIFVACEEFFEKGENRKESQEAAQKCRLNPRELLSNSELKLSLLSTVGLRHTLG
jgi:hypothetical protein